jgi:hypothetical protein
MVRPATVSGVAGCTPQIASPLARSWECYHSCVPCRCARRGINGAHDANQCRGNAVCNVYAARPDRIAAPQ